MSHDRLCRALDLGVVELPAAGPIALHAWHDPPVLGMLLHERVEVVTPLAPVAAACTARGIAAGPEPSRTAAASILCLPRSRAEARDSFARAMAGTTPGGLVLVDGQKTDGVETIFRDIRARSEVPDSFVKFHGRLFWTRAAPDLFADWAVEPGCADPRHGFVTAPGGFSEDGPDPASQALADALPQTLGADIADLGAGWGYLSARILTRASVARVHLVDAHHGALTAARRNLSDPRAVFHWADALSWAPEKPLDAVIMNPPFHDGRAANPELGKAFIQAAAGMLSRGGTLWMVANRNLPYEKVVDAAFAVCETLPAPAGFKIIRAAQPRRGKTRNRETARVLFR